MQPGDKESYTNLRSFAPYLRNF